MLVTFLCPSRGRPKSLAESVWSLSRNAIHQDNWEVVVGLDNDDPTRHEYPPHPNVHYLHWDRVGYARLNEFCRRMVHLSTGRWIFLWNDDAYMETPHWDRILEQEREDYVLFPGHNHPQEQQHLNIFPIVPRRWVDLVGWAENGANDTWWQVLAGMISRERRVPILVRHEREDITGAHKDQTRAENDYDPKTFYTIENYARIGVSAGQIVERFYSNVSRRL